MDFNVKKLVGDAGTFFSRAVQFTEEKLGTSEKTELDAHFENLAQRSDVTKQWTEKIVRNTEAVLTPNPGKRMEDYLFEKIEKRRPNRLSNIEYLGLDMIEAGNDFGPGTAYGSALIKVGQCEQKLGQTERELIATAAQCFTGPLQKFLDGEMKTITRERKLLENKRLDLDACKNRLRKARSMQGQQAEGGVDPKVLLEQAERDLRIAQAEFDQQAEITKLLLEGIGSTHTAHLRCLHEFVEAQLRYYAHCHHYMEELQRELASTSLNSTSAASGTSYPTFSLESPDSSDTAKEVHPPRRARVMYDYEAKNPEELTVKADEVVYIQHSPPGSKSEYFVSVEKGSQKGKVPVSFLEMLD